MTRLLSLSRLAALAAVLVLAGCGGDEAAGADGDAEILAASNAVPVEVIVAQGEVFDDVIQLTGTVDAGEDAQLSPSASGVLTYVAPIGTFVRRGATVAQISAGTQQAGVAQARAQAAQGRAGISQAQAQVEQATAGVEAAQAQRRAAQSQLDLAQDQYNRQRPLLERQIISPLEFQNVESQLASARAQVAQADAGIAQARGQLAAAREGVKAAQAQAQAGVAGVNAAQAQLGFTRVTAPFSGVVEARLMEPGELASPGQPVVRLVGGGGLRIDAGVPERYAGEIEQGTPVTVNPTAYEAEPRGGRVVFVGRAIDPASRTFPIEVQTDNADGALRGDMVVGLQVTRRTIADALVLPQDAVVRDERGTSVFVVVPGDSAGVELARRREVTLGATSGGQVVVTQGLRAGDRVVVRGQSELADGDAVRVEGTRAAGARPATLGARSTASARAPLAAVEPRR